MLDAFADGEILSDENWYDMRDALLAFNIPEQNIMFELIDSCRKDDKEIKELKKYFTRFFDAQMSAASNSSMISEDYRNGKYGSDREFIFYIDMLRKHSVASIEEFIFIKLKDKQETEPDYYKLLTELSKGWFHEGYKVDGIGGEDNSLITNRALILKNNTDLLEWVYENLADSISRRSLNALIRFWLTWDYIDWRDISVYSHDVADTAVYPFYEDEVFVDSGSYIGDTVLQYVKFVNPDFKRVYTYDISAASIKHMEHNLANLSNVEIRHKGTGEENAELNMVGFDQAYHGNKLVADESDKSVDKVKVVRLDDDINEPVSFLKIDCEGYDKETLRGARNMIQRYHPKLHVDSYHKLEDLIEVPRLIREIDPSYTLYLRIPKPFSVLLRFPSIAYMAI